MLFKHTFIKVSVVYFLHFTLEKIKYFFKNLRKKPSKNTPYVLIIYMFIYFIIWNMATKPDVTTFSMYLCLRVRKYVPRLNHRTLTSY